MAGQHEKHHRQGEILIMQGARRGNFRIGGIGRLAGAQRRQTAFLRRGDGVGDIGGHQGRQIGAEQQVGGAARENMGQQQAQKGGKDKKREEQRIARQSAFLAKKIIGEPDERQGADRDVTAAQPGASQMAGSIK